MHNASRRAALLAMAGVLLAGPAVAGCSGGGGAGASSNEPVMLTINLFGDFGTWDDFVNVGRHAGDIATTESCRER